MLVSVTKWNRCQTEYALPQNCRAAWYASVASGASFVATRYGSTGAAAASAPRGTTAYRPARTRSRRPSATYRRRRLSVVRGLRRAVSVRAASNSALVNTGVPSKNSPDATDLLSVALVRIICAYYSTLQSARLAVSYGDTHIMCVLWTFTASWLMRWRRSGLNATGSMPRCLVKPFMLCWPD